MGLGCLAKKHVRRPRSVHFFRVLRRFFATNKPSERRSIGTDIQWLLGKRGDAKALEYGEEMGTAWALADLFMTLLVTVSIDAACEYS